MHKQCFFSFKNWSAYRLSGLRSIIS